MDTCEALDFGSALAVDPVPCGVEGLALVPEGAAVWRVVAAALARAQRAEADRETYRREAVAERSKAHSFSGQLGRCRDKLAASRATVAELRRVAKDPLALQREVERLSGLLAQMGMDVRKRSTIASLRLENGQQRHELEARSKEVARVRKACERRDQQLGARDEEIAKLRAQHQEQRRQLERLPPGELAISAPGGLSLRCDLSTHRGRGGGCERRPCGERPQDRDGRPLPLKHGRGDDLEENFLLRSRRGCAAADCNQHRTGAHSRFVEAHGVGIAHDFPDALAAMFHVDEEALGTRGEYPDAKCSELCVADIVDGLPGLERPYASLGKEDVRHGWFSCAQLQPGNMGEHNPAPHSNLDRRTRFRISYLAPKVRSTV